MCFQGENLDLAITKDEVVVLVGEGVCAVKTLTRNHLYCEPPPQQPAPGPNGKKREGSDNLPEFTVSSERSQRGRRVETVGAPVRDLHCCLIKSCMVCVCFRSKWEISTFPLVRFCTTTSACPPSPWRLRLEWEWGRPSWPSSSSSLCSSTGQWVNFVTVSPF